METPVSEPDFACPTPFARNLKQQVSASTSNMQALRTPFRGCLQVVNLALLLSETCVSRYRLGVRAPVLFRGAQIQTLPHQHRDMCMCMCACMHAWMPVCMAYMHEHMYLCHLPMKILYAPEPEAPGYTFAKQRNFVTSAPSTSTSRA